MHVCESICVDHRVRHLECNRGSKTWPQNIFAIQKIPNADNISDVVTKAIDRKTLDKHFKTIGFIKVEASKLHKQS